MLFSTVKHSGCPSKDGQVRANVGLSRCWISEAPLYVCMYVVAKLRILCMYVHTVCMYILYVHTLRSRVISSVFSPQNLVESVNNILISDLPGEYVQHMFCLRPNRH